MQGKACKKKFDLLKTARNVSPFWIFKNNHHMDPRFIGDALNLSAQPF